MQDFEEVEVLSPRELRPGGRPVSASVLVRKGNAYDLVQELLLSPSASRASS